MCAIIVAMIYNLPKICNPDRPWFQGSVFYEIFPASFKDSDGKFTISFKSMTQFKDNPIFNKWGVYH